MTFIAHSFHFRFHLILHLIVLSQYHLYFLIINICLIISLIIDPFVFLFSLCNLFALSFSIYTNLVILFNVIVILISLLFLVNTHSYHSQAKQFQIFNFILYFIAQVFYSYNYEYVYLLIKLHS